MSPRTLAFNEPLQQRSQRTVEKIVAALEALLRHQPFEDISIAEIITKADVSAGSFYARFATKNALLPVVYARYSAAQRSALDEKFAAASWERMKLRDRVQTMLALVLDNFGVKKWLMRAMVLFSRARPGEVATDSAERSAYILDMGARALAPDDSAAEIERLTFAVFVMNTVAREYALFDEAPLTKAMAIERADFEREMADMIEAYLRRGPKK